MKQTIACFFGGRSSEHEISIISALQFLKSVDPERFDSIPVYIDPEGLWWTGEALRTRETYKRFAAVKEELTRVTLEPHPGKTALTTFTKKTFGGEKRSSIPFDVAIPIFHGQFGEDGCIQGLFELANIPYAGSSVTASALAMNKYLCKQVAAGLGVPTLPGVLVSKSLYQNDVSAIPALTEKAGLQYPMFVKPNNLGSSVGVGVAHNKEELLQRLAAVFSMDAQALVEPCLDDMFEINISVRSGPVPSVVEMPVPSEKVLTYEDKYLRGGKGKKGPSTSQGMASLTRIINPEELPQELKDTVTRNAVTLFTALGCGGVGRFDFMVDNKSGAVLFNELNPIPGSLAFYLWEKSSPRLLYPEIIEALVDEALRNFAIKATLKRDMGFKAL